MKNKFEQPNINNTLLYRVENNMKDFPEKIFQYFNTNKYYIAGGALISTNPNDVDIYFNGWNQEKLNDDIGRFLGYNGILPTYSQCSYEDLIKKYNGIIITKTTNAITIKFKDTIYQLCHYWNDTLEELVESFDFAHIKIGCERYISEIKNNFYISEDFKIASQIGSTFYTGSEYPLSSMIRINKYIERGCFSGKSYIPEVMKIMTDIYERGFSDYKDYLDQLDAVDLGLLPQDLNEINDAKNIFYKFFEVLNKNK